MKKNLIQWIKDFFDRNKEEMESLPETPSASTVDNLINKALSPKHKVLTTSITEPKNAKNDEKENEENISNANMDDKTNQEDLQDNEKTKERCSYALKRNIIVSLQEIRKFAEEHELAVSIIKTLLTILAELAINAMKGKVSPATLLLLMKAINFDKAKAEAFREGEISGRNGKIVEEHFPTTDDGIPHFTGMSTKEKKNNDIFSMAKEA